MKNKLSTILLILIFAAGLALLLYPTVSDYWNKRHASQAVANYSEEVKNLAGDRYDRMLRDAGVYNAELLGRETAYALTADQRAEYDSLLNLDGTGIMGYIEIPAINVSLPIYHGTEDSVLQVGVGHIEWSSLPTGGEDTHCVLSGHRGLPSAKLFTNLDRLVTGDTFVIRVLDEEITYEVDQILIVEPEDVSALTICEGQDLCTLVTCTPYGINTQRLLVRGHRVENAPEEVHVTSDAIQIEPVIVAPIVAAPMLVLLLAVLLISTGKGKHKGKGNSGT